MDKLISIKDSIAIHPYWLNTDKIKFSEFNLEKYGSHQIPELG
jgi:hypothetical protein